MEELYTRSYVCPHLAQIRFLYPFVVKFLPISPRLSEVFLVQSAHSLEPAARADSVAMHSSSMLENSPCFPKVIARSFFNSTTWSVLLAPDPFRPSHYSFRKGLQKRMIERSGGYSRSFFVFAATL